MKPADDEDRPIVILVVEDEMLVRMSAADVLQDAGFHVVEARDGVQAVATLELRDDVGAVFTDVAMPNMNRMALAKDRQRALASPDVTTIPMPSRQS
jgi:CheY-like chemotaxis protein